MSEDDGVLLKEGTRKKNICLDILVLGLYITFVLFVNRKLLLGQDMMKWDIMDAHLPSSVFMSNNFLAHKIPMWNPLYDFGVPHYASIGMPTYYPTTLFFSLIGYSVWAVGAEYSIHIIFACFGMFLLTKYYLGNEKMDTFPFIEFAIGLLYGYSTVFVSNAQHIMIVISATWMPYVFLLTRKYLEHKKILYLLLAGGFAGFSIQGGYPELWVAMFIILIPYFLYYEREKRIGYKIIYSGLKYILFFSFSLLASASILIPFLNICQRLERMNGNVEVISYSLPYIFSMVIPGFFYYIRNYAQIIDCSMISMYMGLITVITIPFVFIKKQKKESILYILIVVFSFLMMLGSNSFLHPLFYKYFPGFSTLRFPSVWRCLLAIFLLLLVSSCWKELFDGNIKNKKIFCVEGAIEVAVLLGVLIWFCVNPSMYNYTNDGKLASTGIISLFFMGIYILIVFMMYKFRSDKIRTVCKACLLLCIISEVLWFYNSESKITVYSSGTWTSYNGESFLENVKYNYKRCDERDKKVEYSDSTRVLGNIAGTHTSDIVYQGKLSEYSYTPLHFKNTVAYRNSYNEKITRGNPVSFLTNNIVSFEDMELDVWLDNTDVPKEQIYISNPSHKVLVDDDLRWKDTVIASIIYNGNNTEEMYCFPGDYKKLDDGTQFRKVRVNIEKTQLEKITATIYFKNKDNENILADKEFQIYHDDNNEYYFEVLFPDEESYSNLSIICDRINLRSVEFLICEKLKETEFADIQYIYPNNMCVFTDSESAGYLVLLQNNYPGWKVYVDGEQKNIELVNGTFMGVYVDAGEHEVVFKFRPYDFFAGMGITGAYYLFTITSIILLMVRVAIRKKKREKNLEEEA